MHRWNTFCAWTSHGHTWIHKIHHNPDLGEATTFPFIILSIISHGGYTQTSFCFGIPKLGVLKFLKLRLLKLWKPIISCTDLRLRWNPKQSCSPCWELSKDMWHTTFTHIIQCDSWLLVVKNQIDIFTLGLFFGHNLCYKYSNGSYEPILKIYVSRAF
jgi:hypothetical protein